MSEDNDPVSKALLREYCDQTKEGREQQQRQRLAKRKQQWEQATAAMLEAIPNDYKSCYIAVSDMAYSFRQQIAGCLEPKLNEELRIGPGRGARGSYGDKKKLATWINGDMAKLGLALFSWEKQSAVALKVEKKRDGGGLFHYERRSFTAKDGPGTYDRLESFESAPTVKLLPADLDAPQWDRWVETSNKTRAGPGRY